MDNPNLFYNIEAEQHLIGSAMVSQNAWHEIAEVVSAEDFVRQEHRVIYAAIASLVEAGKPINETLLTSRLQDSEEYILAGGKDYLLDLARNTSHTGHARHYAEIVRDRAQLRRFAAAFKQGEADISNTELSINEKLSGITERLEQVVAARVDAEEPRDAKQAGKAWIDMLEARHKAGTTITGLPTGFPDFDAAIKGLNKKHLLIVAARPSMGKTTFATNIMRNVLHAGHSAFLATMEMSTEDVMTQLCCAHTGCDYSLVQAAAMNDEAVQSATAVFASALSAWKLTVDDRGSQTVATIRRGMKRHMRRYGPDAVLIVDYAQLVNHKAESEVVRIGEISRSMKELAQDLNIPVILVSQLSRDCEKRPDKRPMLSDLRGSGSLEQDGSEIVFLYDDAVYNPGGSAGAYTELIIAKNRHGKRGQVLPLLKQLNRARFVSPDHRDMPQDWRGNEPSNNRPFRKGEPT